MTRRNSGSREEWRKQSCCWDCLKIRFRQYELDTLSTGCCSLSSTAVFALSPSSTSFCVHCILSTGLLVGLPFTDPNFTEHLVCAFHCALALSRKSGCDKSLPQRANEPRREVAVPRSQYSRWLLAQRPVHSVREHRELHLPGGKKMGRKLGKGVTKEGKLA